MPITGTAGANQQVPGSGTIFAEAVVTCRLPGSTNDIPMGIMQKVSFDTKQTKKKLMGPQSKRPLAQAVAETVTTVKCDYAVFDTRALILAMGGSAVYSAPSTALTVNQNANPPSFKLTLNTPLGGADMQVIFYNVTSDDLSIDLNTHEFGVQNWSGEAIGDPNTLDGNGVPKVFDIILPGNQTNS